MDPELAPAPPLPETAARFFTVIWLLLAMILMAWLSSADVSGFYFGPDELEVAYIAKGRTLAEVLRYALNDPHPPFYHILLHYWLLLTGTMYFARDFTLLMGMLLIPLYYFIGRRLDGRFAGLCCAALVAFSNAVLVESSILRDYTCLMFFMSLAFWAMLRWHEKQEVKILIVYMLAGLCACLTHFLGLLGVFSMCVAETYYSLRIRKLPHKALAIWLLCNAAIAMILLPVYLQWLPTLAFYGADIAGQAPRTIVQLAFLSPLNLVMYLMPCIFLPAVLLLYCEGIVLFRRDGMKKDNVRFLYISLTFASVTMIAFYLSGFYHVGAYVTDARHNLWMTPFVLSLIGVKLAAVIRKDRDSISSEGFNARQLTTALLMLAGGFLLYSPYEKVSDGEYTITREADWQLRQNLGVLDSHYLIVADRNSAFVLAPENLNLYAGMRHGGWEDGAMAKALPMGNTRMLADVLHMRFNDKAGLAQLFTYAASAHLLEGVDKLVFFNNVPLWSAPAVADLARCPIPGKQVIPLDGDLQAKANAALVIIPLKQMNAILADKAPAICADDKQAAIK